MTVLLHERSKPAVRDVLARLLACSRRADFAVSHVRLAAIDLSPGESARIEACRFLLGRLDAGSLPGAAGPPDAGRVCRMHALRALVVTRAIEVRSAGIANWAPDFSVFRGLPPAQPHRDVCVIGAHYFGTPPASAALTCVLGDAAAVDLTARRFDELWQRGHDVSAVVIDSIDRLLERSR